MEISPVNPAASQAAQTAGAASAPAPRQENLTVVRKADVNANQDSVAKVTRSEKPESASTEQRRFETMKRGAQAMIAELYAVSDTRFTIFKDSSGQFITRFTNLKDGTVTYYPEPEVLNYMNSRMPDTLARVEIDA